MGFYRLTQIKVPLDHGEKEIRASIGRTYGIKGEYVYEIAKKSFDARKKDQLKVVYNIDAYVDELPSNNKLKHVKYHSEKFGYKQPMPISTFEHKPIVIGSGPAGLFAALVLARAGLKPMVFERGQDVETRISDVATFFETGKLNTESNIQFGEGGAGTFSDGKINTGVKDKYNRIDMIVDTFIECGAPEAIRYTSKPHIGTDYLIEVVKNIRQQIITLGGEVHFATKVTELLMDNDQVKGIKVEDGREILSNHIVLAIGHSARDTFGMLVDKGVPIEKKAFAVGLRIEHPQSMISKSQFGDAWAHKALPVADYKLTHRTKEGRGVYSFCMCPGGFVVNSASEEMGVVCNGMSNYKRDEANANSAILVNVHPDDFPTDDLLAGVSFQRDLEHKAFVTGGSDYALPIQLFGDFVEDRVSKGLGQVEPNIKGNYQFANLNQVFPPYINEALKEGISAFGKKIKGFDREDAILTGVESRSSSPIRIVRNEGLMSEIKGLYPCGEGAGYAGGIMSAALDGIKVAEAIIS